MQELCATCIFFTYLKNDFLRYNQSRARCRALPTFAGNGLGTKPKVTNEKHFNSYVNTRSVLESNKKGKKKKLWLVSVSGLFKLRKRGIMWMKSKKKRSR